MGVADFTNHFCTLWLQSEGDQFSTPGAAAAAGLAQGIATSESAGPVSIGMQPVQGLEAWGAWNLTAAGVRFATVARAMGAGPMLIV